MCSVCQTDMFNDEPTSIALAFITHDGPKNSRLQFDIRNGLFDLFIHLNVIFICLAAVFGPWSEYGDCGCDSLQYRSRVCEGECVGESVESIACECVPFNAAGMTFFTTSVVLLVITNQ